MGLGVGDRHETLMRLYPGWRDSPGPIYFHKEGETGYASQCGQYINYP